MPPYDILYIAKTAKGGSAFSLLHLVTHLDRSLFRPAVVFYSPADGFIPGRLIERGIPVETLSPEGAPAQGGGSEPPAPASLIRRLSDAGRRHNRSVHRTLGSLRQFIRSDLQRVGLLYRTLRRRPPDLVHVNNSPRSERAAILAARLAGVPCLAHIRLFPELSAFDLWVARQAAAFVYNSRAVADHCLAAGLPADRGVVIHNPVDFSEYDRWSPEAEQIRSAVRAEFGWPADAPLIGVVGRLDWWKGHAEFLEAVALASRSQAGLRALVVGAPETTPRGRKYHEALLARAAAADLRGRVVFTGFRSDVARLMTALDVIVLSSSLPEPFGRVVIEGMAAGRPVVATAAGGVLDIIQDGVDGLLVPAGSAERIAEAVAGLLQDPARARRLGQTAQTHVRERFAAPVHAAQMQRLYAELLAAQKSGKRWTRGTPTAGACHQALPGASS